jgi:hypothetical protein
MGTNSADKKIMCTRVNQLCVDLNKFVVILLGDHVTFTASDKKDSGYLL